MPDYSKLTPEEKQVAETNLKTAIESYQRDLTALTGTTPPPNGGGSGGGAAGDLQKKITQEEADAELFDRLPTGERTRLYLEDRATFDRLKEARRELDMRRLLDKARP